MTSKIRVLVNPGSFHSQLNKPTKPQTTIITVYNAHKALYNAHKALYIHDIYIQYTVYHNDRKTITQPTQNSTEELLHPNIINLALPVSLNQKLSPLSTALWREWSHSPNLFAFNTIQGLVVLTV